jgi:hypothetical protein
VIMVLTRKVNWAQFGKGPEPSAASDSGGSRAEGAPIV